MISLTFSAPVRAEARANAKSDILCETESKNEDGRGLLWLWDDSRPDAPAAKIPASVREISLRDVFTDLDSATSRTKNAPKSVGVGLILLKDPKVSQKARPFALKLKPREEYLLGTHQYPTEVDNSDTRKFYLHDGGQMATGGYLVGVSGSDVDQIKQCFVVPQSMRDSLSQSLLRDSVATANLSWKCATPSFLNSPQRKGGKVRDSESYAFDGVEIRGAEIKACQSWLKANEKVIEEPGKTRGTPSTH